MFFSLFKMVQGRFSKDKIEAAKTSTKKISRQEALQQMRNLAKKSDS
ncbi:hypothetical protein CLV98_10746 [Dyadobacter jejuensis]|uniref:Uncharacterized protein n=1 Tax=Dyadobacter jejuensis TaxID=1082580 RepID=A0A316AJD1_9BACT|nr:hypothetical protein CLV98_10746 [Dyadobacter jejuensis]